MLLYVSVFVLTCYSNDRTLMHLSAPVRGLHRASCPGAPPLPPTYTLLGWGWCQTPKRPIQYSAMSSLSRGRLVEKILEPGWIFPHIPVSEYSWGWQQDGAIDTLPSVPRRKNSCFRLERGRATPHITFMRGLLIANDKQSHKF